MTNVDHNRHCSKKSLRLIPKAAQSFCNVIMVGAFNPLSIKLT